MCWVWTPASPDPPNSPTEPRVSLDFLYFVCIFLTLLILNVTVPLEQAPPRPPLPAVLLKSECSSSSVVSRDVAWISVFPGALEPFYDSVMDDYEDEDEDDGDAGVSSGMKRLGMSLGLKLRPWEGFGVRSAKSEVSLIDFTDDSFSSNTPSPLTESRQADQDTLKVRLATWPRRSLPPPQRLTSPSRRSRQDMPSILDWPLPQPAYDEVAAELEDQSEDQEVRSIYRALTEKEETASTAPAAAAATARRNESQSADLFQELQREVEVDMCTRIHRSDRH